MSIDTTTEDIDRELDALGAALAIDDATADLLFREAHTTYGYADEPVTDEQVRAAWDLVRWAPTMMNSLPMRLLVVRSDEGKQRLAAHMAEGNRQSVLDAPVTIVAAADPAFHRHFKTLAPFREDAEEQFEAMGEAREGLARTSSLIQVGYLILGLRAAGLAVGPKTGFDAAGLDADLLADKGWKSLVVITAGVAAPEGAHKPRQARLDFETVAEVI
ncbi:malonic semialdehyde reductase [Luteimicrobium xylanilyticum]|uniref:NADH dehydrogenase/NAD(P)H nitroreductase n=1 Tax=Luteimicrobium xylanilyticum TaxID=1133546 RepID=A0A5P9Q7H2_9MICO|nr:malonic semialdehyde reductase [Luteimicrobium xylanilyticum]QFU97371.1 Putative NADH dehydrogenase/NAD(P)H nitroreductase [Luteimicrobium xylanilyticum]